MLRWVAPISETTLHLTNSVSEINDLSSPPASMFASGSGFFLCLFMPHKQR